MGNKVGQAIVTPADNGGCRDWSRTQTSVLTNAVIFCKMRNLPFTPIMESSSLEDLLETLEASSNVAVALFNAGLQGDPTVDPEISRQSGEVLRRIRRQTIVLERSLLRRTWRPDEGGDEWVDMHMGIRRRFHSLRSIAKKVLVEHRIVQHWKFQTNLAKTSAHLPKAVAVVTHSIDIESWSGLDVFEVDKESRMPLSQVFMTIWSARSFDSLCRSRSVAVFEWIQAIEAKYQENPYHNRMHAADVAMAAYYLFVQVERQPLMSNYFSPVDLLVLVISAAIHDVGHPGLTNDFLVKTKDLLALRYNDKSVLENMHLATAFELMKEQGLNVLDHSHPSPPSQALRGRVIEMVLATDMALHKALIENFAAALDNCDDRCQDLDKLVFERLLLHVADIGHPLRPRNIHREWSKRVTEEFFSIGDREKQLGLSPMALFDRDKAPPLAKGQVGFLTFVVKPSWNTLARALGTAAEEPGTCFENNLKMWEDEELEPEMDVQASSLSQSMSTARDRFESRASGGELFCDICSHHIDGAVAKANGRNYHISCFKCDMCKAQLSGAFVIWEDKNFCTTCGDRKEREANPECVKCKKQIEGLYKKLPDGSKICTACSPQDSCDACRMPIAGKYLEFHGKRYHKDCFMCQTCKGSLAEGVFTNKEGTERLCKACMSKKRNEQNDGCDGGALTKQTSSVGSPGGIVCGRCGKTMGPNAITTPQEDRFHPACFICERCGKQITDDKYTCEEGGKYALKVYNRSRKKYYCKLCTHD